MNTFSNSIYYDGSGYRMQKKSLLDICNEVDKPSYIYDMNYILDKYQKFIKCFDVDNLQVFYAMKANYNPHILRIMKENGLGLDAVSPAEVLLGLKLGFDPKKILFTGNNMTDEEMDIIHNEGVLFIIDSLSRLEEYGKSYPGSKVGLRINPDVVAGETPMVQTAGDLSKFGILMSDVPKAIAISKKYNIHIIGLHEHTGSGISDLDKVIEGMKSLIGIAKPEDFPDLEFIDFGGGFKVPYSSEDVEIDYVEFGKRTTDLFKELCNLYQRDLSLYFEPGKYLVADSGAYLVQVNTIKDNRGRLIVGTNGSFTQLIRPMLYDAYHHIVNLSNPEGSPERYDVYGNICESTDCFAFEREIPKIRVGDYLAIMNAGGYCRSMASEYNLRPFPSEYLLYNDDLITNKKSLTPSDLAERVLKDYGL